MSHSNWFKCSILVALILLAGGVLLSSLRPPQATLALYTSIAKPAGTLITPTLVITPDHLGLTGVLGYPHTVTATAFITSGNAATFTWTAHLDSAAPSGLDFSPVSGTVPSTLAVSANTGAFTVTGTFVYSLYLTTEPTMTLGNPFTLPITLRILEPKQTYLPLVEKNVIPLHAPVSSTTHFGLDFVTSIEAPGGAARFGRAKEAGADMDRWPIYWYNVEKSEERFEWAAVDQAVISDTDYGLQPLPILMLTPGFYQTGGNPAAPAPRVGARARSEYNRVLGISSVASPPARLYDPVFDDGTDIPSASKNINANNPWARFVYKTVNRYKPGGELAQARGWPAERGVKHWEIWNEEDWSWFWNGTNADYARLLKVAFLAARHADPQAKIIIGGLANFEKPTWLADTLAVLATYPDRDSGNWFFDGVAQHNYALAWNTWNFLYQTTVAFDAYSLTHKSLWVTESGVALCDEYPGPPCVIGDSLVPYRANPEEQAAFVFQSAVYATWLNSKAPVEGVFHFLLYDDCSDPVAGTPYGGGFGLIRNPTDSICFNESPQPDTPRPAYLAFQLVNRYLRGVATRWRARPGWDADHAGQEWIVFYNPATQERIVALWARGYAAETAAIPATSSSAQLIGLDGEARLTPANGVYSVALPAATNRATYTGNSSAPIGGRPYFLVELDPSGTGGSKP